MGLDECNLNDLYNESSSKSYVDGNRTDAEGWVVVQRLYSWIGDCHPDEPPLEQPPTRTARTSGSA